MTEAITITAIIVAGLVSLAWLILHFGYKAWRAERVDAIVKATEPPVISIHAASIDPEAAARAAENHLAYALRNDVSRTFKAPATNCNSN